MLIYDTMKYGHYQMSQIQLKTVVYGQVWLTWVRKKQLEQLNKDIMHILLVSHTFNHE
jgi:hypothetical protein